MRDVIDDIKEAFLTGVSYMLPFVVAGGILVALGFLLGGYNIPSVEPYGSTFASTIFWIGKIGLGTFMVPVLGAYVAYSIADKPGICVGMFGGWMATDPWGLGYQSGFIGALIAGIIAGYLVNALKKIPLPNAIRSLLPTLIIPVVGCAAICLLMHYVIGGPLGALCMITEFAIPYAAKNIKYIPCFMVGSAAGAVISYLWGITIRAPHGGVFVVFAMNKVLPFFITLLIAGAISAALIVLVTKPQEEA